MTTSPNRRVAFYRRSATQEVEGDTLEAQLTALQQRLEKTPGAVLVGDYEDAGVSGLTKLSERPAGGRLCRDAGLGDLDDVWATEPSQLGVKIIDTLDLADFFSALGVALDVLDMKPQREATR